MPTYDANARAEAVDAAPLALSCAKKESLCFECVSLPIIVQSLSWYNNERTSWQLKQWEKWALSYLVLVVAL